MALSVVHPVGEFLTGAAPVYDIQVAVIIHIPQLEVVKGTRVLPPNRIPEHPRPGQRALPIGVLKKGQVPVPAQAGTN